MPAYSDIHLTSMFRMFQVSQQQSLDGVTIRLFFWTGEPPGHVSALVGFSVWVYSSFSVVRGAMLRKSAYLKIEQ